MKSIINPNLYHGKNKKENYFEGWYFKVVSKDNKNTFAFIPGISMGDRKTKKHSFVQVLQGDKVKYNYCMYSDELFGFSKKEFGIRVDQSTFSLNGISLNINKNEIKVKGSLKFKNIKKWEDSLLSPGSMGFYNYLSFMECYSQVCVLDGDIEGSLTIDGEIIDLNGGKVYIEKNWGKSFPVEWLWVQSNSFEDNYATLTCSVGEVPFPLKNFRGFLIGVTVKEKFYKFTTMNRSKLDMKINNGDIEVSVIHENLRLIFRTESSKDKFILCYGPRNGGMIPLVNETLTGEVYMKLEDIKTKKVLYEGVGHGTGIEYGGNLIDTLSTKA